MTKEIASLVALVRQKQYRNLIFDLDETLTRLDLPWEEWVEKVTASLSAASAKDFEQILESESAPSGELVNAQILKDPDYYERFIRICQDFESKYFAHTPYDDLIKVLPGLKEAGCDLFLWTSNTRQTAERALIEMGVLRLFTQLLTREDVRLGKPHTEGWKQFTFADQNPGSCLMIGDSQNDELTAKAHGVAYFKISFFKQ